MSAQRNKLAQKAELLMEVSRQVPEAIKKLNEEVIDDLFETVRSIFVRINSHPLFRDIAYDTQRRRSVNHLLLRVLTGDEGEHDSDVNPSYIFSAAQINAVAVSFFLAMSLKQNWSPLQLVGMDDPVQNMDDLNVLALVDLIRMLVPRQNTERRQFIISTHDPSFYELMIKKFRFLRVGIIEYEGYSERGPVVVTRILEPSDSNFDLSNFSWESKVNLDSSLN